MFRFKTSLALNALALSLCALTFPATATAAEEDTNPATRATNFTLVEAKPSISPRVFEGSDGVTNLVYELVLTNFNANPMTIDSIDIYADDSDKVLLSLSTEKLKSVMTWPGTKKQLGQMAPGVISLVFVNIPMEKNTAVPSKLVHKIIYTGKIAKKQLTRTTMLEAPVDKTPAVVIGAPLVGKKWLAAGGYAGESGHRRSLFPVSNQLKSAQRFAIDWVQFNDDNKLFTGTGKENSMFTGYGKPVLAVGDGTIFGIVDKFKDQPPFVPSGSMEYPGGNTITLKLSDNAYAMYAHLKPGSMRVKEGDTVKKGQVIAEVGNVGNSDGTHLHLHITEGPEVLESNGVPYVFEEFKVCGSIDMHTLMNNFAKGISFKVVKDAKDAKLGVHRNQLIKEGTLVDFPELAQ